MLDPSGMYVPHSGVVHVMEREEIRVYDPSTLFVSETKEREPRNRPVSDRDPEPRRLGWHGPRLVVIVVLAVRY